MGNIRAFASVAVLVLGACGGGNDNPDASIIIVADAPGPDAPKAIDAPPAPTYDFSCMTNPAPTTATTNVVISGLAQQVVLASGSPTVQAAEGATIKACKGDCNGQNLLDTLTVPASGAFATVAIPTMSLPFDGYLDGTKTGNRRTLVYPAAPLIANTPNVPMLMLSNEMFALVQTIGATQEPTKGVIGLSVVDCAMTPIASGVTLSIKQGGTEVVGTTATDLGSLASQGAGTYLVFNVPAGATEVGAVYMGMTLRAHVVDSLAGATTTTIIRPGY